jgi:hypothetical protein
LHRVADCLADDQRRDRTYKLNPQPRLLGRLFGLTIKDCLRALETGDFDSKSSVASWFQSIGWRPGEESKSGRSGQRRLDHHLKCV